MQVEIAKSAGFCFGVERSISQIEKALKEKKKVFLLKQPIHNPVVLEHLQTQGAKIANSVEEIPEKSIMVIRAHGEVPETFEKARAKKLEIIDCTCPFVAMVQKKAKELEKDGYQVIIVGEKGHAEVLAIKGNTKNAIIAESPEEARKLFNGKEQLFETKELASLKEKESVEKLYASLLNKVGIVSQTTQTDENFSGIVSVLSEKAREVRAFNTICSATHSRQPAAEQLAKEVDAMVVVGGKNSGNTQRLFEISQKNCKNAFWIETAKELKKEWFQGMKKAGITAGASTPKESILEAKEFIEKL